MPPSCHQQTLFGLVNIDYQTVILLIDFVGGIYARIIIRQIISEV